MNKKLFLILIIYFNASFANPNPIEEGLEKGICVNFQDIPAHEFVRFVSKVSGTNFIFDHQDLQFNISFSTGKTVTEDKITHALIQILKVRGFHVADEGDYHVIHKTSSIEGNTWMNEKNLEFLVHKLQYQQGSEIEDAVKKIAANLKAQGEVPAKFLSAVESMQWVKATNSLLCSGDKETLTRVAKLVEDLDQPLKQVFIEILVVETDVRKSMDFGLQWTIGGVHDGHVGGGMGNFPKSSFGPSRFAEAVQSIGPGIPPIGLCQIPIGCGFDMGIIGDVVLHKGKTYLSLGALASALQTDGDSTIVLNQKIVTQDNKNSKIFVGDNLPFTGSIVQTVGQSQQTTANIEYRDIGVSLSITPTLGEGDVVTLSLDEEISQALGDTALSANTVSGIRTTKTNMATHVHVPDKHFLVLSGMMRSNHTYFKSGIPCLGSIPILGALFSTTHKKDEKRYVMIFVRPHIIRTTPEYQRITDTQEALLDMKPLPSTRIDTP